MKRDITYILAAILASVLMNSCSKAYDQGYYDDRYYETNTAFLTLRNYSSDTTVWFIPDAEYAENLPSELSEWQKIAVYEVAAHSATQLTFDSKDSYVTPLETFGVNDRMVIYVFKKDVWDNYDWTAIVEGRMWCGKCSLSVEEARGLNGIVTYPMR